MRMDGVGIGNAQVMCGLVVAESHTPLELKDTTKQKLVFVKIMSEMMVKG